MINTNERNNFIHYTPLSQEQNQLPQINVGSLDKALSDIPYEPRNKESIPLLNSLAVFEIVQNDYNGAFLKRVRDALANQIPVFCSRRLLTGRSLTTHWQEKLSGEPMIAQREIAYMLGQHHSKWDIFLDKSRTQVFILSRNYYGSLQLKEKLATLGISWDAAIPSSWEELLKDDENIKGLHPLTSFFSMVIPTANRAIRLQIAGHGNVSDGVDSGIAGLPAHIFTQFVNCLNRTKCEVLAVHSCGAGRENRKYYPTSKFPIIVFSIGDFPTSYSKIDNKLFFSKCDHILQNDPLIHEIFEKQLATNSGLIENWTNYTQIRLPNSQKFRLIQEDRGICILKKTACSEASHKFTLTDTRIIALYARSIFPTITLENEIPFFLSMRQETKPVHIFSSFRAHCTLDQLFENTRIKVSKLENRFHQIFFFRTLICKDGEYQGVYVRILQDCGPDHRLLAYRIADKTHIRFPFDSISGAVCHPETISAETYNQTVSRDIDKDILNQMVQNHE